MNSIGIDLAAGYGTSPDPATDVARDGAVSDNRVTNAHYRGGGRFAAGVYVDGGRNITVERNVSWKNNVGIEVGSVHAGRVATNVTVRDNLLFNNARAGLSAGSGGPTAGSAAGCRFTNNTLYRNGSKHSGSAGLSVQTVTGSAFENNLISGAGGVALVDWGAGSGGDNTSDYNLYFSPGGSRKARFVRARRSRGGLDAFRSANLSDANSLFADPLLVDPRRGELHLAANSPAVNAGDPLLAPADAETDIDGQPRLLGSRWTSVPTKWRESRSGLPPRSRNRDIRTCDDPFLFRTGGPGFVTRPLFFCQS